MDKEFLENASQIEPDIYQTKMRQVNEAILAEIKKAINKLFEITVFPPAYRNFPGDMDYRTFVKKWGSAIEQEAPQGILWAFEGFNVKKSLSKIDGNNLSSEPPDFILTGYLFLSPQYNPPEEVVDILLHLGALYLWHKANADIQSYFFAKPLALAFGKLLAIVSKLETSSIMKADRELTRIKKTNKTKKDENDKRKSFVIAIYDHGENIEAGTKSSKVCTAIIDQFTYWSGKEGYWGTIPKDMPISSRNSIKRWLKEAGILDRDFRREGSYWIKQT